MARYDNPAVPHEVNVGKTSPLGEFLRLALALLGFSALLVVTIHFGMRLLAPTLPFRYEHMLAQPFAAHLDSAPASPTRDYLQTLAEALASHMACPPELQLTVHLANDTTPNAFATLGGHIVITQGLLDTVDSENALAMVLAHEIAHIWHRDPIVAAGSGMLISLSMGLLLGSSDFGVLGSTSSHLTQLRFSRNQEFTADDAALKALRSKYGHTAGADTFFNTVLQQEHAFTPPAFLSTHPDTRERLQRITETQTEPSISALTPLPTFLTDSASK